VTSSSHDVTNPKTPVERFRHADVTAFGVTTSGARAWVPSVVGLYSLDLTTPTQVMVSGPVDLPTLIHNRSAAQGDQLVVVTDRARLLSIDVSAPAAPVGPRGRRRIGVRLLRGGGRHRSRGLRGRQHRRPAHRPAARPRSVRPRRSGGRPDFEDLIVVGSTTFVADWFFGLRAYDVADPAAPRSIVEMAMQANPSAIDREDTRLYLGQATNGGMVWVFDITTPASPRLLGQLQTPQVHDLKVRNKIVYVAGGSFAGEPGLALFDASDPTRIAPLGRFACKEALDVALADTAAVVACSDGFHFVDVSNPAQPVRRAGWTPAAPHGASAVAAAGTRAFLGDDAGMTVFDLSNPAAPVMVSRHPTAYPVVALRARTPEHVLAAAGLGGIYQWTFTPPPGPVVPRVPGPTAP
jgi:hypothetical protein